MRRAWRNVRNVLRRAAARAVRRAVTAVAHTDDDRPCADDDCPACRSIQRHIEIAKQVFATRPPAPPHLLHDRAEPAVGAASVCADCGGPTYWTGDDWFCPRAGCHHRAETG